jgi:hypothetical protein
MGHGAWGMGHGAWRRWAMPQRFVGPNKKTRLKGGGGIENGIDIGFEVSIYIYIRY